MEIDVEPLLTTFASRVQAEVLYSEAAEYRE